MNDSLLSGGSSRRYAAGCLLTLLGASVLLAWLVLRQRQPALIATPSPTATQVVASENGPVALVTALPRVPAMIDSAAPTARAAADLNRLFSTTLPALDYAVAAVELAGAPEAVPANTPAYVAGDRSTFQTADGRRTAELVFLDDLAAYWVESGLTLDRVALAAAAGRLRDRYYPLLSTSFGREARPGIDDDYRLHVLHILGPPDAHELGYFREENQYPRALFNGSNEREMVYLNMSELAPGTPLYDGTLVHEVQHLIQWNLDANEDTWLNEGLSQVAETLVGLATVDATAYRERPYVRLDRWNSTAPDVAAHYAGSYLYLLYLWERAGDAALSELARHPANGMSAVRAVLAGYRPDLGWEQFSGDFAAAVYLDGAAIDPRYSFAGATNLGPLFLANRARQLPFEAVARLDQMALDVIDLDFEGPAVISFAGDAGAALLDEPPPASDVFWYALPGNSSRAQLTTEVDLTGVSAAALDFAVWHDLETGYDFAYLSASTDGGQTWQLLSPARAEPGTYGPAWGGASLGWARESIPLSAYAGRVVRLRFDVVTDIEGLGRGFAVARPVIAGAAEQPVWQADGFVETGRVLPQQWEVRLIREGAIPEVVPLPVDSGGRGQIAVELGPDGGALVIMPLTPFVETMADYWVRVAR